MSRSYEQHCALALALDVVGERWTMLVLRDLILGPKRYSDLQAGLPGISPNILADRLRELENAGLVDRRKLPPPAASTVYQLTPRGREIEPALTALAVWGKDLMGKRAKGAPYSVESLMLAFKLMLRPEVAGGERERYEISVDEQPFVVEVDGTRARVRHGSAEDAVLRLRTDARTFARISLEGYSVGEAVERGALTAEGSDRALRRFAKLFALAA